MPRERLIKLNIFRTSQLQTLHDRHKTKTNCISIKINYNQTNGKLVYAIVP